MEDWIAECAELAGRWNKVAAEKALIRLLQDRAKSTNELLMGYALARDLLNDVFARYAAEKQTLSEEGAEKLELAVRLARESIPLGHPLMNCFLREASIISDEYSNSV